MIKKTYIPGKPRNPKLGTATGTSGVGKTEFNQVAGSSHEHYNKSVLDQITEAMLIGALRDMITSTDEETELTDDNILSSLRVLAEIAKNNEAFLEELRDLFLSKVEPDTAQELITFAKGLEVGTFSEGVLGSGAAIKMLNGTSYAEVDHLLVRQKATFVELVIESLKHVGGQLILSPARMKCVEVVDGGSYYRCYFDNDGGAISNEFVAGDQARCQVFTGSGTKFYWRLVTSVGDDWINLSKTDAVSGSDAPASGDDIVQLGNRTDTTRQSAIILSTVGIDAPSWKQYSGINSFDLANKETTVFTRLGNRIQGKTVFTSGGSNLDDYLDATSQDIQDTQAAVENLQVGGVNLLDGTSDGWQTVTIPAGTVYLNNFFQGTELEAGQEYIFSWEAEWISGATDMWATIGCGATGYQRDIISALNSNTHAFNRKSIVFTPSTANLANNYTKFAFRWYNNSQAVSFRYRKLKLETGNKKTDWDLSKKDRQDKVDEAKQEALTAAGNAQTTANSLKDFTDTAFRDGIIDRSESIAIEKYKNSLNEAMAKAEASFAKVFANTYLEGTAKTALENAKINLWGQRDTLLSAINTAIADGKTTVAEKNAVDSAFNTFNSLMSAFQSALEEANKAIQKKLDDISKGYVDNIQIGGRNLFSVNNFVADNKVRGYNTINVIEHEGNIAYRSTNITNNHNVPRYLQGKFEANTQYYLKFNILWESFTDSGAQYVFTIRYTDGSSSTLWAGTSHTTRSLLTTAGKTIDYITTTRQFDGTVVIYNIQIKKENKLSDWIIAQEDVQVNIDKAQQDAINAKLTAEQAQLQAEGFMRARYIRDWVKGNTLNVGNHWREIEIYTKNGTNIALGKTVTGRRAARSGYPYSNVTDGDIATFGMPLDLTPAEADWVRVDLGQIYYDIDYIHVWHPFSDGRTYYGTKTEISEDGINWTTIFDSAIEGTYKETEEGKIHSQRWAKVMDRIAETEAKTRFQTLIDGGLIYTALMKLFDTMSGDETAFISGKQGAGKNLPAFGAGGSYQDALAGTAKAIIRHDGTVKFTDAEITGTVNATSGSFTGEVNATSGNIGGMGISGDTIVSENERLVIDGKNNTICLLDDTNTIKTVIRPDNIPTSVSSYFSGSLNQNVSFTGIKGTVYGTTTKDSTTISLSGSAYEVTIPPLTLAASTTYASGVGSSILTLKLVLSDGGSTNDILIAQVMAISTGVAAYEQVEVPETKKMITKSGIWRLRLISTAETIGGGTGTNNGSLTSPSTTFNVSEIVNRSEIGSNGMMVATSASNYNFMVGDTFEVRRGNGGLRITNSGIQKWNGTSWVTANI